GGGIGATDLELILRQVSCSRMLERYLMVYIQQTLLADDQNRTRAGDGNGKGRERSEGAGKGEGQGGGEVATTGAREGKPEAMGAGNLSGMAGEGGVVPLGATGKARKPVKSAPTDPELCQMVIENAGACLMPAPPQPTPTLPLLTDEERGRELLGLGGRADVLEAFCLLLGFARVPARLVLSVLEARVVWNPFREERWKPLSERSLTCAHLASRLRALIGLPLRLRRLWRERHSPLEKRSPAVAELKTCLCRLGLDFVLGVLCWLVLVRSADRVLDVVHEACHFMHVEVLREEIEWLNYFPAGFKLNVPLTTTLGRSTLVGMDAYASMVAYLVPWEGMLVWTVGLCCALGGLTSGLAVSLDLMRLLSVHTTTAHMVFSAIHNLHSSLLGSLWQLLRGRKVNILRLRVDSCQYDARQLLLGTLVFTTLFLLVPTVAVYHTFFCLVHGMALAGQV
ncbi:unnamed protein product, partial [Discosporangium mesarthrocarpum]